MAQVTLSGEAVEALADFLLQRDWPTEGRRLSSQKYEYRVMAAAVLNGEAWAIRKAWPGVAHEIADTPSRVAGVFVLNHTNEAPLESLHVIVTRSDSRG